jgi:hypothetical protein
VRIQQTSHVRVPTRSAFGRIRVTKALLVALPFLGGALQSGCKRQDQPSPVAPAVQARSRPDSSLTTEEYISLGLPAPDREWVGADMGVAAKVLAGLLAEKLPRWGSAKSGRVFARMVDDDNLSFHRNSSLSIDARLDDCANYMAGTGMLLKVYYEGFTKDVVPPRDVTELLGMMLKTVPEVLTLMTARAAMFSREEPSHSTRMQGFEQVRRGAATVIAGALQTLSEYPAYSAEDLGPVLRGLESALPRTLPLLSRETSLEVKAKVAAMANDPKLKELHTPLGKLVAVVETIPTPP